MKWDVFISHASEDKDFVRQLAEALAAWGLSVWFDEFTLQAGDSLRRAIDNGLAESRFGVVVLSPNFFAKEWPRRELDGLVAREDGTQKIIIPVWYQVSAEDVRRFSPTLADRLSIYSNGPAESVVEKIVRAIYHEINQTDGWTPILHNLPDGTELVVLPIHPQDRHAVGIGRHPITNAQYRRFLDETGGSSPVGEVFRDGQWQGPFLPFDDPFFNSPQQPVVCVDCKDAHLYCKWVTATLNQGIEKKRQWQEWAFIPPTELWDFAATGARLTMRSGQALVILSDGIYHQCAQAPALVNEERTNMLGISDMFGNVWEWCTGDFFDAEEISLLARRFRRAEVELRGGGFLDDLSKIRPMLRASMLDDGLRTRHADLGFRIAALVELSSLPTDTRARLTVQDRFSRDFWNACHQPRRYDFDYDHFEYYARF